jgi:hypothetical protein
LPRCRRSELRFLPGGRDRFRTCGLCRVNAARPHAHPCGTLRRTNSVQVNDPQEPKPRDAACGVARHGFWQIAGKTLGAHQYDSDRSAAGSETSLWQAHLQELLHEPIFTMDRRLSAVLPAFRRSPGTVSAAVMGPVAVREASTLAPGAPRLRRFLLAPQWRSRFLRLPVCGPFPARRLLPPWR